jgi:CubicO group peptidase (beta-lactamase class C family)
MQPTVGGLSASAEDLARFIIAILRRDPVVESDLLPLAFEQDYTAGSRSVAVTWHIAGTTLNY